MPQVIPLVIPFIAANAGTIGAVTSVAGAALGAQAQNEQAQAQMDSAAASDKMQQQTVQLQQVQINQAASQEAQQRAAQTNRQLAKFMVASGASGVTGVSLERAQAATGIGEQIDLGILEQNRESRIEQSQLQALGIRARTEGRINAAEASGVGPLQATLGIVGAGFQGYQTASQISTALAKRTKTGGNLNTPVPLDNQSVQYPTGNINA